MRWRSKGQPPPPNLNFAILSLDIAWCYLACHAVSELPDADLKLQRCEEKFKASYGSNMERVAALKGSQSNELALMARLHLLQVCLFVTLLFSAK